MLETTVLYLVHAIVLIKTELNLLLYFCICRKTSQKINLASNLFSNTSTTFIYLLNNCTSKFYVRKHVDLPVEAYKESIKNKYPASKSRKTSKPKHKDRKEHTPLFGLIMPL
jgi:hypothetical protein